MLELFNYINFWLIFGFAAQFMFFLRFVIQWLYSEKKKESVIPISFWYFSIVGATMIFIYAIHIKDPVFIVGQSLAIMIYLRNLYFIKNKKNIE
jgi:lipid-A-disaccharide synthase-like uncharacterized protein